MAVRAEDDRATATGRAFAHGLTRTASVRVVVRRAAFFVPSGAVERHPTGSPIPGSCRASPLPPTTAGRRCHPALAPADGLFGIEDLATGMVSPFSNGRMVGSVSRCVASLAIGAFIGVVLATGAPDRGLHALAWRCRTRGRFPLAAPALRFGVLGTTMRRSAATLGTDAPILPPDRGLALRPDGHGRGDDRSPRHRPAGCRDRSGRQRRRSEPGRRCDR